MMNLYSYIVRYDSGFAPNPFYGFCTLATCKPQIRKGASVGDWVVGIGSSSKKIGLCGKLVYAMRVSETMTFSEYFTDSRFQNKKPILTGSKKQARGDNVYHRSRGSWHQLDSFHSEEDGSPKREHIDRDTRIDRVLIGENFVYFGAGGPSVPDDLRSGNRLLCHTGIGLKKFTDSRSADAELIMKFESWLSGLQASGYVNHPYDWSDIQR